MLSRDISIIFLHFAQELRPLLCYGFDGGGRKAGVGKNREGIYVYEMRLHRRSMRKPPFSRT